MAADAATADADAKASARGAKIWSAYSSDRPWVAASPGAEAAATCVNELQVKHRIPDPYQKQQFGRRPFGT